MEEIRETALAYYANSSEEVKKTIKDFFETIDTDGDGKVSIHEFEAYVKKKWRRFKTELFAELDSNDDGFLDLEEVVVFFYMVNLRNSFCDVCGEFIKGVFFTCVECFKKKNSNQTYDLCLNCYRIGRFTHEHRVFLDNYALLNSLWSDSKKAHSEDDALKALGVGASLVQGILEILTNI